MKNRILVCLLSFFIGKSVMAQNTTANQITYTIFSSNYKEKKLKLDRFVSDHSFSLISLQETISSFNYEFIIPDSCKNEVDELCSSLGYVSGKQLNTFNNETRRLSFSNEVIRLEEKKKEYELLISKMDSSQWNNFYSHWSKIRDLDAEIFSAKKAIRELEELKGLYYVTIYLNDETNQVSNRKVKFVHMPGAEYVYFVPQTPKMGTSFDAYQGVNLKYVFTKGKSYFSLGALRAINPGTLDSSAYNEFFSLAFGQDWYSQNFGRGNRKFFNLYIGYQVGYSLAYSNINTLHYPFISPETGLEIFKNKHFLFDVNMNYSLPIVKENRYLRGYRFGASLNFTF